MKASRDAPQLFYVRNMVRKRISDVNYNHYLALRLLTKTHAAGVSLEELEAIARSMTGKSWKEFCDALAAAAAAIPNVNTTPTTIGDERIIVRGKLCELKSEAGLWHVKSSRWILKRSGQCASWSNVLPEDCFESAEAAAGFARSMHGQISP